MSLSSSLHWVKAFETASEIKSLMMVGWSLARYSTIIVVGCHCSSCWPPVPVPLELVSVSATPFGSKLDLEF